MVLLDQCDDGGVGVVEEQVTRFVQNQNLRDLPMAMMEITVLLALFLRQS